MLRVVVCDDEDSCCALMRMWLEKGGVEVLRTCRTRDLAIMACVEYKPDLLVMDYQMPGEVVTVPMLPGILPGIPILLWTGYDRADLPPEVVVSVSGVLVKGIDWKQVTQAVHAAVEAGPPLFPGTDV